MSATSKCLWVVAMSLAMLVACAAASAADDPCKTCGTAESGNIQCPAQPTCKPLASGTCDPCAVGEGAETVCRPAWSGAEVKKADEAKRLGMEGADMPAAQPKAAPKSLQNQMTEMSASEQLQNALMAVDRARRSMDANDRAMAGNHLENAKKLLAAAQERLGRGQAGVVLYDPIARAQSIPDSRIRSYNGRTIVFSSDDNARQWDQLSASDKQERFRMASEGDRPLMQRMEGGKVEPAKPALSAKDAAAARVTEKIKQDVINSVDPISGDKLDKSQSLSTRTFNGRTIGFANESNAKAWDALSAEDKTARFDAAIQGRLDELKGKAIERLENLAE